MAAWVWFVGFGVATVALLAITVRALPAAWADRAAMTAPVEPGPAAA